MHHNKIRDIFLNYFKKNEHLLIKDASLIPKEHDPSALFTNSGMHPIKPYFLGLEKPPSKRLCSIQKSLRTVDIDKVGYNKRTLTFFFMLGSWSIGDYGKGKAIELAWNLLTKEFRFDKEKLWVTAFRGDSEVSRDNETINAWQRFIAKNKIVELGREDNFWSAGAVGPCGPCTEIYFDRGEKFGCKKKDCKPGCDCDRFLEIWNAGVFMQYNRKADGKLERLPFQSVDTGAGLERLSTILQKKDSVFETTLFYPLIERLESLSNFKFREKEKEFSIIADHLRASCFIIADGVRPGKNEREYILRRLLRRLVLYSNLLNVKKEYKKDYDHLHFKDINNVVEEEYNKFIVTLNNGTSRLRNILEKEKKLSATEAFHLYDTYGFPFELTQEIANEYGVKINKEEFNREFEEHKEKSKISKGKFKAGLVNKSEDVTKLHTATHLLHQALRNVLGNQVQQKGSNITEERLRFDFNYEDKLSDEEIKKVEDMVNEKIKENLDVKREEMTLEEAKEKGALSFFTYKNKVSVYSIGKFSKEVCEGPHVKNTRELGKFKILKEEGIGKGLRRIKAVLV